MRNRYLGSSEEEKDLYSPEINAETRKRIRVALAAYAYEINSNPIMNDGEFDELAKSIDLSIDTRRPDLDKWFRENFQSHTGSWIHSHPEKEKLEWILEQRS